MPIYDFECKQCGVSEHFAKMDEEQKPCADCGKDMKRLITVKFTAHGDLEPYLDHHIGKEPVWIESKRHRRQVMQDQGVCEKYGKGWV